MHCRDDATGRLSLSTGDGAVSEIRTPGLLITRTLINLSVCLFRNISVEYYGEFCSFDKLLIVTHNI